jgi:hypothetical protein
VDTPHTPRKIPARFQPQNPRPNKFSMFHHVSRSVFICFYGSTINNWEMPDLSMGIHGASESRFAEKQTWKLYHNCLAIVNMFCMFWQSLCQRSLYWFVNVLYMCDST